MNSPARERCDLLTSLSAAPSSGQAEWTQARRRLGCRRTHV